MELKRWQSDSCILGATTIGAAAYPVAQWTLMQMDVLFFHTLRFPLLALIFLPFAWKHLPPMRQLPKAALPGVFLWLGIIAWSIGVMTSEQMGSSAFIISLQSILAPLLARVLFGTKLRPMLIVSLLIATAGLALLSLENGLQISRSSLWMMLAACMLSMYLVTNSYLASQFHPLAMSWAQFAGCALLSLASAPFLSDWRMDFSWTLLAALFYMVIIATGLRFTLMSLGQRVTPAAGAAMILVMEPVMVALIGWSLMNEQMSTQQLMGCGLIMAACLLALPRRAKKQLGDSSEAICETKR